MSSQRDVYGKIKIYLDSLDGVLFSELTVKNTGGWQSWKDISVNFDTSLESVYGIHDVYIVFEGGSGFLMNINWFNFDAINSDLNNIKYDVNFAKFSFNNQGVSILFDKEYPVSNVVVYNLLGNIIYKKEYTDKKIIFLNKELLKSGMFFVSVNIKDKHMMFKLLNE